MGRENTITSGSERRVISKFGTVFLAARYRARRTTRETHQSSVNSKESGRPEMPIIETKRLKLRVLQPSDAATLHEILSDPKVLKHTSFKKIVSVEDARAYITRDQKAWNNTDDEKRSYRFAAVSKATKEEKVIGLFILTVDEKNKQAERLTFLHSDEHGKKYGPEGQSAIMEFGFEQLGLHKIHTRHGPENEASGKAIRGTGLLPKYTMVEDKFVEGELLEDGTRAEGKYRDSIYYEIFKHEWEEHKQKHPEAIDGVKITMMPR